MTKDELRALCMAAMAWHEGDPAGHERQRQAKRALRRETHAAAIVALLNENERLRTAAQAGLDALDDTRYVSKYSHIIDAIAALEKELK